MCSLSVVVSSVRALASAPVDDGDPVDEGSPVASAKVGASGVTPTAWNISTAPRWQPQRRWLERIFFYARQTGEDRNLGVDGAPMMTRADGGATGRPVRRR